MARLKGRDRRLGWSPPTQINAKITEETHRYIQAVAVAKNQRNVPLYSTLECIIKEYDQLKEDLEASKGWLALALNDKETAQRENKELREKMQSIIDISIKATSQSVW